MTAMSHAQLAASLGVHRSLVTRDIGRGMPADDVEAARAWRAANVRARARSGAQQRAQPAPPAEPRSAAAPPPQAAPPVSAPADAEDYGAARARREAAEAHLAELRLRRENGEVLDREQAVRAIVTAFRQLRDTTAVLGRSVAPVLAASSDARECQRIVDAALRGLFEHFAARVLPPLHRGLADAEPLPADVEPGAVAQRMAALAQPAAQGAE